MRHWKLYYLLELQELMVYCACMWCLGERHSSKEFLRDLGCHIDLGRGHLFFEKLGVRAVVTSEQSPHLLLRLTSFGPQGHKIPAEIQPRISSDECPIYRGTCDSSEQNKIHSWIASTSDHGARATDSTDTESLHGTGGQEENLCDEARDYLENIEYTVSPDEHYSTQCATNSLLAITSLTAKGRLSDSWDNRARCRLMIPGHKRLRCEASGRVQQSFGQTICHRTTPGNPTDIIATCSRSFAII